MGEIHWCWISTICYDVSCQNEYLTRSGRYRKYVIFGAAWDEYVMCVGRKWNRLAARQDFSVTEGNDAQTRTAFKWENFWMLSVLLKGLFTCWGAIKGQCAVPPEPINAELCQVGKHLGEFPERARRHPNLVSASAITEFQCCIVAAPRKALKIHFSHYRKTR